MAFSKENLLGDQYSWESGDSLYTGMPSRRSFDRNNGNQVLFLINYYDSINGASSLSEGRRMENLIRYQLPENLKSEVSVFNWLRASI